MTESKSDTQAPKPADTANKPSAPQAGSGAASRNSSASGKKGVASRAGKKQWAWAVAFIVVVLVAIALAGGLWWQHKQFKAVSASLATQVRSGMAAASQASRQARQALERAGQQSEQLAALRASLEASQEQVHALGQAVQNLSGSGSDVALVNDIDHIVTIANQQLTLNGNVSNAIVALESAQARLARANRPGLASLQQTINGDLDSLRAASVVDVAALTGQLNKLSTLVGQAALLVPDAAAPELVPENSAAPDAAGSQAQGGTADAALPAWRRALAKVGSWSKDAWHSTVDELHQLVSIRRVSDPAALLLSPDQARQLRENLRLRIMTAQLALMMHESTVWQSETRAVEQVLYTRFDNKDPRTRQAAHLATQLAQTKVDVALPTLNNTLRALQTLREQQAQADGDQQGAPDAASQPEEPGTAQQPGAPDATEGQAAGQAADEQPEARSADTSQDSAAGRQGAADRAGAPDAAAEPSGNKQE
jgi:uroporphyrin-3 C-methyltransferase